MQRSWLCYVDRVSSKDNSVCSLTIQRNMHLVMTVFSEWDDCLQLCLQTVINLCVIDEGEAKMPFLRTVI